MAFNLHLEEVAQIQGHGQELYRDKQYRAALECFSSIISEEESPPLSVLDNRAATYIKLEDLQSALRDARHMIQIGKAQSTGYLRTGKVLQLLDKKDVALGIYQYGIRNVPADSPDARLLRGMYDKLAKRCSPPTAVDPMQVLPPEIAEMILAHLSFKNIVGLLRVSKQWYRFLESMPGLWTDLDFSAARRPVGLASIRSCVRRSRGTVSRTVWHRYMSDSSVPMRYITSRCQLLNQLEIPFGFTGSTLIKALPWASRLKVLKVSEGCKITLDSVCQILCTCRLLEVVEFRQIRVAAWFPQWPEQLSSLRSLTMGATKNDRGLTASYINKLFTTIPHVRELALHWMTANQSVSVMEAIPDYSVLSQLQKLSVRENIPSVPKVPSSLKTLDLGRELIDLAEPRNSRNLSLLLLPELRHLTIASRTEMSSLYFERLLSPNKGNLEKLDVSGAQASTLVIINLITAGYLTNISELALPWDAVNDELCEHIATHLHCLKSLDLRSSRQLTGIGVKALVLKPRGKLERLNVDSCVSIGVDAVQFARSQGIEVSFKFEDIGKGKRLRLE